ncbi:MAG TPA: PKD domain-containing protein [Anaerolineae bacterium]|nr:PKD domain-containing protein [Anaerolineae bacterium]
MQSKRFGIGLAITLFVGAVLYVVSGALWPTQEVRGKSPAVPVTGDLTDEQLLAQDLALNDIRVHGYTVGRRSEVFGVRDVMAQYPKTSAECATASCWQVEIYNFDEDAAVTAIVNVDTETVLDVLYQPGMHPGINKRLSDVALDIALNHPDVIEALGFQPEEIDMAPVDSDLVNSSCDGTHICAGPTFNLGERILWAVIDLTTEELAGLYWTPGDVTGSSTPFTPEGGCPAGGTVDMDGWVMDYETTGTDGFRVSNVSFGGTMVATSIKTAEWHADYGGSGYVDSTGCGGGGGGFPIYPYGETRIENLYEDTTRVGFEMIQDFRMGNWGNTCNYRYEQRHQFFLDGSFRIATLAYGKGCGTNSMYRPIVRMDLAIDGDDGDSYARWDGSQYVVQNVEEYWTPYNDGAHGPHLFSPEGYNALISDATGLGYYMEMGQGQFGDNGRGDQAFVYLTAHDPAEGDTDLGVIGNCCLDNHQQGPDAFVNGEAASNTNIVLWYVPQMLTDVTPDNYYCWTVSGEPNPEAYPCYSGPKFHPAISGVTADFGHSGPILVTEEAQFTNRSSGDNLSYLWSFGDGNTSTDVNPTHMYAAEGIYTVELRATNDDNVSDSTQRTIEVIASPQPEFDDDATEHTVAEGEPIQFYNNTVGVEPMYYTWDFGDSSPFSNEANPVHAYDDSGLYMVTLTVSNTYGINSATQMVTVTSRATANFDLPSYAFVGESIQFDNLTTGIPEPAYTWDFGDGSPTSNEANPTHTYLELGTYEVTLTAINEFGGSTKRLTLHVLERDNVVFIPVMR